MFPVASPSMSSISEHLTPPKTTANKTSTTMTVASILPIPPNSPFPSAGKPLATPVSSAATLPATPSSQIVEGAQASSQPRSPPAANTISTTNIISTQRTTATKLPAAEKPPPRTLAAFKRDLHIDGWQCGAQTLRGTECKRYVIDGRKDLIDAQLASMMDLTRASPNFASAVLKLVKLVHCYQHDAGRPREHRLGTWRLSFPPGSAENNVPEVSIERFVRKALEPLCTECIAHGNGGACKRRIGGWKMQNCERTIQELIKQEIYSDDAKLEFLLKVLEWNRTCNIHQSSEQFIWVVAWKKNIMAVLPSPIARSDQTLVSKAPNEPQTSSRVEPGPLIVTNSLTGKRAVPVAQVLPNPRAPPGPTISPGVDPALYRPKAYESSRFNILPHANQDASPTRSHKLIRAEINRLLDARDLRDGYVYSYEVEGNEGYVKVGYTTRLLKERHDE